MSFGTSAHPATAPPQAQPAGVGQPNIQPPNCHTGRCFARPRLRSAGRLRPRGGAERSAAKQWPEWMFLPYPLCMRRGAQRAGWHVCRRTHMLRELTRRSCLNVAPKARSEFCDAPRPRAPQVARNEAKGRRQRGCLFFGDFLLAKQKKATRMPGDSRPPPSTKARTPISARLRQAQPELSKKTIKTIATDVCWVTARQ